MSKNILSQFPEENNDYRRGAGYYIPITIMAILFLAGFVLLGYFTMNLIDMALEEEVSIAEPLKIIEEPIIEEEITQEVIEELVEEVIEEEPEPVVHMTDDDIIAAVVMAEAGNQDLLGKTAVAATILNRADYFDLTIEQVVNAKDQYSYPYTGVITESCYRAVEIARQNRDLFPSTMMWFKTNDYHTFADHYNKIGDHFFNYLEDSSNE